MIPGEIRLLNDDIELNINGQCINIIVINNSNKPIQIGSHFHFYEVNTALYFHRKITLGYRLNIPAGTTIRFEPGQIKNVQLVSYSGMYKINGFCKNIMHRLKKLI